MKTIAILFDVSGLMQDKFDNLNQIEKVAKKSDQLIGVLKKLSHNIQANVFAILFGLQKTPYIFDFIKVLKIYNTKLKKLKCEDDNNSEAKYRNKYISYLSKDQNGNDRYYNIRENIVSNDGPSEKLSEFFCNLMQEERGIIDNTICLLKSPTQI